MKNYLKIPLISFALLVAGGLSAMNKCPWSHEVRTAEDVKRLCGGKFDVKNLKNKDNMTILTYASKHGDSDIVAALLDAGVDIESIDGRGITALQMAAYYGQTSVVKLLIDRKANINALSLSANNSALHLAARKNQESAALLLIAYGAALDVKNKEGATPLQLACGHNLKLAKLIAAVMAYQDKNFPDDKQREEVEIGREIGMAMREAERTRSEYPVSKNAEHTKIIEFIRTLKNLKLRSRI